jgi:FG-GAP repeat
MTTFRFAAAVAAGIVTSTMFASAAAHADIAGTSAISTTVAPTLSTATLAAKDGIADDSFGSSVAATADTIVVGVPYRKTGGQALQGAVYVFSKPAAGWSSASAPATLTIPSDGNGDRFGYSVAIQGDTIVVGAPEYGGNGEVLVFTKPTTGWAVSSTPTATLTDGNPTGGDELGSAVAIDGSTIVAGADGYSPSGPAATSGVTMLYTEPAGGWADRSQTAILGATSPASGDYRGYSVAISGNTVVAGAEDANSGAGAAYVYVKPSGPWVNAPENADLTATDGATNDHFGASVAISGTTVAVGAMFHASERGAIYVYNQPTVGWANVTSAVTQDDELTAASTVGGGAIGSSVAFSGNTIAAGGPFWEGPGAGQAGEVLTFTKPASGWKGNQTETRQLLARAPGVNGGSLGVSVAISGTTVIGGADGYSTAKASELGEVLIFGSKSTVKPAPKPTLTKVTESPKKWKLGHALPAVNPKKKPKGGTEFSFRLNEKATVTFTFTRATGAKHTRVFHASFRSGENHLYFDGAITKKVLLTPGKYKVSIVAKNAAGVSTAAHELAHVVQQ